MKDILDRLNILYTREKVFPNCKYKKHLRFDFYIESLNMCIEFDGLQHFKKSFFIGKNNEELEIIQLRDQIKNDYCRDHGITLVRFRYDEIDQLEEKVKILIEESKKELLTA